jgi:hypothetical protein
MSVIRWLFCQLIGRRLFDRLGCQRQKSLSLIVRQTGQDIDLKRLHNWHHLRDQLRPGLGQPHFTRPLVTGTDDTVHKFFCSKRSITPPIVARSYRQQLRRPSLAAETALPLFSKSLLQKIFLHVHLSKHPLQAAVFFGHCFHF